MSYNLQDISYFLEIYVPYEESYKKKVIKDYLKGRSAKRYEMIQPVADNLI